jgi:hypothetical protein
MNDTISTTDGIAVVFHRPHIASEPVLWFMRMSIGGSGGHWLNRQAWRRSHLAMSHSDRRAEVGGCCHYRVMGLGPWGECRRGMEGNGKEETDRNIGCCSRFLRGVNRATIYNFVTLIDGSVGGRPIGPKERHVPAPRSDVPARPRGGDTEHPLWLRAPGCRKIRMGRCWMIRPIK